jgi:hypothetical protein
MFSFSTHVLQAYVTIGLTNVWYIRSLDVSVPTVAVKVHLCSTDEYIFIYFLLPFINFISCFCKAAVQIMTDATDPFT